MFVLINLKAYDVDPATIAHAVNDVADEADVRLAIATQAPSIYSAANVGVETWAQHVSPISHGSHTGSILPEAVASAGANGTLLNHSEHRLTLDQIDSGIAAAHRAGLETIICANTPEQVAAVTALGPDAVAVEPPELIGSGIPVSRADPDIVTDAVEAAAAIDSSVPVLCGAGISDGADVTAAASLGAQGVLLASGVAKAEDPVAALSALIRPFC